MPKFGCRCGANISLTQIPSPNEGRLSWDTDRYGDRDPLISYAVVRCPECERLYIEQPGQPNTYDCFVPEEA